MAMDFMSSVAIGLLMVLLHSVIHPIMCVTKTYDPSEEVVQGINHFGLDIHRELSKQNPDGNIFFSPLSISSALAMTLLGAKAETATQMKQALNWNKLTNSDTHQSFRDVLQLLATKHKAQYILEVANRLFIQKSYHVLPSFLLDCQQYYKAPAETVDFAGNSEETRIHINDWVANNTNGKIENLLKSGILNEMTRLVLINAVYFKGDWAYKFKEEDTEEALFHVSAAQTANVQMMFQKGKFNVGFNEALGAQVLELPYKGFDLQMTVILPDEKTSITEVEKKITAENLLTLTSDLRNQTVELYMPRFILSYDFDLGDTLSRLGITDLFDARLADLSGVTGTRELFVSRVVHKAYLEVNEEGSQAAAATASVMQMRMMVRNIRFVMNRPFMFLIKDSHTGTVLFMGRVVEPSAANGREEL